MSLTRILAQLLAKADQPALLPGVPIRKGLRRELRADKRGRAQHRWIRPGEHTPHTVMHMAATSSTLDGDHPDLGVMVNANTTGVHRGVQEGRPWCMDNGAYSGTFKPGKLLDAMDKFMPYRHACKFVVAPDVLGDGPATEAQFAHWRAIIRAAGYPAAFVAHRGTTQLPDCDALFVPALNLEDPHIPRLVEEARRAGKWVHVGRVNSAERTASMRRLGADSVDGTYPAFTGIERGKKDMGTWMDAANAQAHMPTLLGEERNPESIAAFRKRAREQKKREQAITRAALPLDELPAHEVETGMMVGHGDRVGVLFSEPDEHGYVHVAFHSDPLDTDADPEFEYLPAADVHGPIVLAQPFQAAYLMHRALAAHLKEHDHDA